MHNPIATVLAVNARLTRRRGRWTVDTAASMAPELPAGRSSAHGTVIVKAIGPAAGIWSGCTIPGVELDLTAYDQT